jgi:hypothetical protein
MHGFVTPPTGMPARRTGGVAGEQDCVLLFQRAGDAAGLLHVVIEVEDRLAQTVGLGAQLDEARPQRLVVD